MQQVQAEAPLSGPRPILIDGASCINVFDVIHNRVQNMILSPDVPSERRTFSIRASVQAVRFCAVVTSDHVHTGIILTRADHMRPSLTLFRIVGRRRRVSRSPQNRGSHCGNHKNNAKLCHEFAFLSRYSASVSMSNRFSKKSERSSSSSANESAHSAHIPNSVSSISVPQYGQSSISGLPAVRRFVIYSIPLRDRDVNPMQVAVVSYATCSRCRRSPKRRAESVALGCQHRRSYWLESCGRIRSCRHTEPNCRPTQATPAGYI